MDRVGSSIKRSLRELGRASKQDGLVGYFGSTDQLVLFSFELMAVVNNAKSIVKAPLIATILAYAEENGEWPSFSVLDPEKMVGDRFLLKSIISEQSRRIVEARSLVLAQADRTTLSYREPLLFKKATSKHAIFITRRGRRADYLINRIYWEHFLNHVDRATVYSGIADDTREVTRSWGSLETNQKPLLFLDSSGNLVGVIATCQR